MRDIVDLVLDGIGKLLRDPKAKQVMDDERVREGVQAGVGYALALLQDDTQAAAEHHQRMAQLATAIAESPKVAKAMEHFED